MGSAPKYVSSKGDVLSDADTEKLFGSQNLPNMGAGALPHNVAMDMLYNWMYGIQPKAIDPGEEIGRASQLSRSYEKAAAGSGYGGAFGYSKALPSSPEGGIQPIEPLGTSPMAPGVPYKVPPLPKFKAGGG